MTRCAYIMEGENTAMQCGNRDGYGPEGQYCKSHTRLHWPGYETSSKRKPLPKKEPLETPWAKKLLEPFTKWKTRHAWPAGSVLVRRNNNGFATMPGGYKMPFGLGVGTGDYIGFKSIIVTPKMVGQRLAVFVSIEAKRDGKDLEGWQQKWHDMLIENGALSMRAAPETKDEVLAVLNS